MSSLSDVVRRYFPAVNVDNPAAASGSDIDGTQVSQAIYTDVVYTDSEKAEIKQELTRAWHISADEDDAKRKQRMGVLNTHLSNRTTLLGSKPSVADIVLYAQLSPLVKAWSEEEKTGEHGYHNIVRYIDFIQNSPLLQLSVQEGDKVKVDPSKVQFVPQPIDPKQEKERKKKEKAAKANANDGDTVVVGRTKDQHDGPVEEIKGTIKDAAMKVKGALGGETGASTSKKEKKEKKERAPKPQKQPAKERELTPAQIDLRVGHILKAIAHPNADSLYVSTIAVGDPPGTENTSEYEGQVVRTVCSGLNGLIPLSEMQNRKIVAVCNLKPVTMRGIKSSAMVLAASPRLAEGETDSHAGPVELVNPPTESSAGDRILFDGWDGEPESVLNPKKKVWDMCQVGFTTTDDLGVAFDKSKVEQLQGDAGDGKPTLAKLMVKGGGPCTVVSLKGAVVR